MRYSDPAYACNQDARLWDSGIIIRGDIFRAKSRIAITIAVWVWLERKRGHHSIFNTVGSSQFYGQYYFDVDNDTIRWFHRDDSQGVIFESMAHTVERGKWQHIAGTYDSKIRQTKIF